MEKISVIVPIYNCESYLDKCLTSIINQTYKEIEIILINDGSTDNSLEIIKHYAKKDKRIIIIDKKNQGVSIARNEGIKKSTGKYLTFVDADDYLEKNIIEEMYHAIKAKKVEAIRVNYKVHYKDSKKIDYGNLSNIGNKIYKNEDLKTIILKKILDGSLPCFIYLLLVKKEVLMNTNLFNTEIHMMEDVIFYVELITKLKNLYILNKPLYNINYNEYGATNNKKNHERNINDVILVNKYIKKILKEKSLDNTCNITNLNTANAVAISDFIFKNYLSGLDALSLCKKLTQNDDMQDILKNINWNQINKQRKYILKSIKNNHLKSLNIYFALRKKIHNLKVK